MTPSDSKSTGQSEKVIRHHPASLTALLNPEPESNGCNIPYNSVDARSSPTGPTFSVNGDDFREGKKLKNKSKEFNPFSTTGRGGDHNRGEFSSTRSVSSNGSTISTFTTFPFTTVTVTPHQPGQSQAKRKKITPEQLEDLLAMFEKTDSPSFDIREKLAKKLNMTNREIQVWFQNRRAKVNRERLEAANRQSNQKQGKKSSPANQRISASAKEEANNKSTPAHTYPSSQYLRYQNEPPSESQPNYKQRIPPPIKVVSPTFNMLPSPISPYGQSLSPLSQSRFSMQTLLSPLKSATSSVPGLSSPRWNSPTRDSLLMTPTSDQHSSSSTSFKFVPQNTSEAGLHEHPQTLEPQVYLGEVSPVTTFFATTYSSVQPPNCELTTLKPLRKRAFSMGHVDTNSMDVLALVAVNESSKTPAQNHKRSNSANWKK
ncbi:hypothetical protein K7432_011234 [Basidiobolus ranarum]|uniref:Homeobox domain-containing protein n=1 Tax=Basidiobolus ranarum TaxID=34480 RepID=A0ABR2WML2_9FUNG